MPSTIIRRSALIILAALSLSMLSPANAEDLGYTKTVALVAMPDGTHLDANVFVPTATAPPQGWPLIVRQHGGGSNKDSTYDVDYALRSISRGFAVLMYSARGHGNSEGSFDFFGPQSVDDFSRMLDWVDATFPSIDVNNVGTSGYSQGGGLSLLPAEFDERVKAVAVGNTFDSLNHALNPNDCFKFAFATGIFAAAYKASASKTNDDLAVRWGATLYTDTEDVDPGAVPWLLPVPPPALPRPPLPYSTTQELASRSPITYVDRLISRRVPVFWSNSWEDQLFPADHPESILSRLDAAGIPTHYWFASGGHAAGPNDPADEAGKEAAILNWFDQFLRGVDHGFTSSPKVDYAQRVPDSTGWTHKQAPSWPLATTPKPLFVASGGSIGAAPDPSFSASIANDLVNANVANDSIVANELAGRGGGSGFVHSLPDAGTPLDTKVFSSDALTGSIEFTGAPSLHLEGSSTANNVTQINAKLWDVAPNGALQLISKGCWSGKLSSALDLSLWPNSHVYAPGHRIAYSISSVDFPTFEADKEPQVTTFNGNTRLELPVVG